MGLFYENWNATSNVNATIKQRPCKEEDFNFEGNENDSLFYHTDPTKTNDIKRKLNALQCVDEQVKLTGNFDTEEAQVVGVLFLKCDTIARKTCKTDAQVKEWLKEKFLLLVYNKK